MQENLIDNSNKLGSKQANKIEYFSKEIETLKKNQIELLKIQNTLKEMKYERASLGHRADPMKEKISVKDRNLKMTQKEEERET